MLLAIDIGNTNITLGRFRAGTLLGTRRAATAPGASTDELEVLLEEMLRLDGLAFADVDALAVVSVVPALTACIEALAARRDRPLLIAAAGTIPVPVCVDRPAEVGADRLVNALADGAFLGGAIAPGLELGLEALAARTAKLPRIELRAPDRAIGRDTVTAIQAGAVLGYEALATGLLARIRRELADQLGMPLEAVRTILTGGLSAAPWAAAIEGVDIIDPDLTLKGLAILHAEVAGGEPLALGLR